MIDIFVCDDDERTADYLKFLINRNYGQKCHVVTMNSCMELLGSIVVKGNIPDLLIMDINLKDGNGIEIVKEIQKNHTNVKVVYLTGVINYATEIFETNPSYFLVKPIDEFALQKALEKVFASIYADKSDAVFLKMNGSEVLVLKRSIMYIESRGRKLTVHRCDGPDLEFYEKMDAIQEQVGGSFVRSHKSFLVNMKYITERTNKEFILADGRAIPISKTNLKNAKIRFISYLGEM